MHNTALHQGLSETNIKAAEVSRASYRPDIDGLRAIAVLLVVIFHGFPTVLPGGFVGVDVFFVISGYLITSNIIDTLRRDYFSLLGFYARRVRRIFPALAVVLLACLAVGWFELFFDEYRLLGRHVAAGAYFVSNLLLWSEVGYFDTAADRKPLLHLWSLGVEEQFYIAYPIILWAIFRFKTRPLPILIALGAISFIYSALEAAPNSPSAFYSPFSRFWQLNVGGILACLGTSLTRQIERRSSILALMGLLAIFCASIGLSQQSAYPGLYALAPTLGAGLVLWTGTRGSIVRSFLRARPLVWIGLISYPLYLWHWPLLAFTKIFGYSSPSSRGLAIGASFLLATATYQLIERPIRFKRRLSVRTLCVTLFITGALGWIIVLRDGLPYRATNVRFVDSAIDATLPSHLPNIAPCPSDFTATGVEIAYCNSSRPGVATHAIIGDSHAEDKFLGLGLLDSKHTWLLLGAVSCAPVLEVKVEADAPGCDKKIREMLRYVTSKPEIHTVVLAFYGGYMMESSFSADHVARKLGPESTRITSDKYQNRSKGDLFAIGLNNAAAFLEQAGKHVIVTIDTPELPVSPLDCIRLGWDAPGCVVDREAILARQAILRKGITEVATQQPGVRVYDPLHAMCRGNRCFLQLEGKALFKDSMHLSNIGSIHWAKNFLAWMDLR